MVAAGTFVHLLACFGLLLAHEFTRLQPAPKFSQTPDIISSHNLKKNFSLRQSISSDVQVLRQPNPSTLSTSSKIVCSGTDTLHHRLQS